MRKMLIVLAHTYWTKVKSKTFMVTTLMIAMFMLLFLNLNTIISFFDGDASEQTYDVLVIDENGELYEPLAEELESGSGQITVKEASAVDKKAEEAVMEGQYDAYLQVTGAGDAIQGHFYAPTINETFLPSQLASALQNVREAEIAASLHIDEDELAALNEPVPFEQTALDETARSEAELNQARLLVNILLFVIYFSVLFLGNMIASEVATEKSSRVMEILISSASPVQQMFGKIIGVGLIGLTQYTLIFIVALISFAQFAGADLDVGDMNEVIEQQNILAMDGPVFSLELFLFAFLFFILGYLLYATLAAMLGSIVTRIEDVGQAVGPMNMLVILALMISVFSMGNPGATIVTIASYIPFFTPMIMFLRVGMGEAAVWEVLLSISIMVVTITLLTVIAARVYRGGVLLYNHSRMWKRLKQALLLTRKSSP